MALAQQVEFLRQVLCDRLVQPFATFFHTTVMPAAYTKCVERFGQDGINPDQIDIQSSKLDELLFEEIRTACESIKAHEFAEHSINQFFAQVVEQQRNLPTLLSRLHTVQSLLLTGDEANPQEMQQHSSHKLLNSFLKSTLYFCAAHFSKMPCLLDVRCTADRRMTRIQMADSLIRDSIERSVRSLLLSKVLKQPIEHLHRQCRQPSAVAVAPLPQPQPPISPSINVKMLAENGILKAQIKELILKLAASESAKPAVQASVPVAVQTIPVAPAPSPAPPVTPSIPDYFDQGPARLFPDLPNLSVDEPHLLSLDHFDQAPLVQE